MRAHAPRARRRAHPTMARDEDDIVMSLPGRGGPTLGPGNPSPALFRPLCPSKLPNPDPGAPRPIFPFGYNISFKNQSPLPPWSSDPPGTRLASRTPGPGGVRRGGSLVRRSGLDDEHRAPRLNLSSSLCPALNRGQGSLTRTATSSSPSSTRTVIWCCGTPGRGREWRPSP